MATSLWRVLCIRNRGFVLRELWARYILLNDATLLKT